MPEHRIIGLARATVNPASRELHFELLLAGEEPIAFVAESETAERVTPVLGQTISDARRAIIAAEMVVSHHVEKDQSQNFVIMRLTTPQGIPCAFALAPERAAQISEQLKAESSEPHQRVNS